MTLQTLLPGATPGSGTAAARPRRWWWILGTLGVLGLLSRLLFLSHPTDNGVPVFDEKHYVPQSWQVLRGTDGGGGLLVGGIEDNPGFGLIVHPPLAKHLEALGMAVFGNTPWGWRIVVALLAVGVILLTAMIARRLTGSDWVGMAAGVIALCDGILFVTGRSAMLDHFQVFFIVLAVYLLIRDHGQMEGRFGRIAAGGRIGDFDLGPRVGYRWWRFAAGVALGCASAVKWSGLYYIAFFGLAVVGVDWWRRRRYGVRRPFLGTFARDCVPAFASLVIVPAVVYLLSWRSWFASETGVFRHEIESGNDQISGWGLGLLPDSWLNFIYYHVSVLGFHEELTNSNGHNHPWESKPWEWLATTRALLYHSSDDAEGNKQVVLLLGTPVIWWLTVPVLLWGLWRLIRRRDMRWLVPVVGYLAGFLPWLLNVDRQMYLFYATNLAPFLIIGIALVIGQVSGWALRRGTGPSDGSEGRDGPGASAGRRFRTLLLTKTGMLISAGYLVLVVWMFLFFLPIFTAMPITVDEWRWRMWLPGWT
ncbi:MAG: dolichyl-phosphate-mannose--protein mannosyltransferase [Mycobacteriaceae bacterium]|uniref:dolichyl-phosphate-mannose--protein mannosyltransferase n=1 Tax=Corynebacterium sp. TaxID=1720 RepID=UPI003F9B68C0